MPFLTTPERLAKKKVLREMIIDGLRLKFGEECADLIRPITDLDVLVQLEAIHRALLTATTQEEFRRAYAEATAPPRPRAKKTGEGRRRKKS